MVRALVVFSLFSVVLAFVFVFILVLDLDSFGGGGEVGVLGPASPLSDSIERAVWSGEDMIV